MDLLAHELLRIRLGEGWCGYLTLDNFDEVVKRLEEMLIGRSYALCAIYGPPQMRAGLHPAVQLQYGDGQPRDAVQATHTAYCARFEITDSSGLKWGCQTQLQNQTMLDDTTHPDACRVRFHDGQAEFRQLNPDGPEVLWVVSVYPDPVESP